MQGLFSAPRVELGPWKEKKKKKKGYQASSCDGNVFGFRREPHLIVCTAGLFAMVIYA